MTTSKLINKFYDVQYKIVNSLNEKYKDFIGKAVKVIVTEGGNRGTYSYDNIVMTGFAEVNGFLYFRYKSIKADGSVSVRGGEICCFEDNKIEIELAEKAE